MSELFLKFVNMSISASWLVLAVLVLRFALKKAPKWVNVLLWGIVAVRLICPFSIESALSLIPSVETVSPEIMMDWTPEISTGIGSVDRVVNPIITATFAPEPIASANPLQILIPVSANFWLLGIIVMLLYTTISYWRLRRKVREAVILRDNIYQSENVSSPFVLGIIKPRIYLSYNMEETDLSHVVAHEQAHIRRRDHWWKPVGFLLLTVYWFNPLMWLAYVLLCRDIELACDEKVIKEMGNEQRADYSQALVSCSVNRRAITACPLAFGEVGVKKRVKSVLNYRKPAFWLVVLAVVVCIVVAVCFLTNPAASIGEVLKPGTSWVCEEYQIEFSVDENYVIEGSFTSKGESATQTISIGYRYAGMRNAVADVFDGNWEWAQKSAEEPLLSGKFVAKNGNLILEVEKDNVGLDTERIVFVPSINSERKDVLSCNALSKGINAFVELACFPDTDIDRDTDNWPITYINESGVLQFSLEGAVNTLVVSEDYYRKSKDSTLIERNTFEISRNDDGFFTIDTARRESLEDHVNYFIKIKGQSDVYVMKVVFKDNTQIQFMGELIPGTTYVSWQCLYMNPLSSYAAMGGDSGFKYIFGEDYFVKVNHDSGDITSFTMPAAEYEMESADCTALGGADIQTNVTLVEKWKWQAFPYSDEEWAAMYFPDGLWAIENISEQYSDMLYQPLNNNEFLLQMDGSLWLVNISNDPKVGTYIWSIYTLVPESVMGVALWEYAPMLSSRSPVFRFDFDMDYTEIIAFCPDGYLVNWDSPDKESGHSMTYKRGEALCWSPQDEDEVRVSGTTISFSVKNGEEALCSGTLYIDGTGNASDGRIIYTASIVGTGLHLSQNTEYGGAVVSAPYYNQE